MRAFVGIAVLGWTAVYAVATVIATRVTYLPIGVAAAMWGVVLTGLATATLAFTWGG